MYKDTDECCRILLEQSTHAYLMMSLLSLKFSTSVALVEHMSTFICSAVGDCHDLSLGGRVSSPFLLITLLQPYWTQFNSMSTDSLSLFVLLLLFLYVESIFLCLNSPDFSHQFLDQLTSPPRDSHNLIVQPSCHPLLPPPPIVSN